MKILCIGEAMVELSLGEGLGAARMGVAGDVLNTAIYLRRNLAPGSVVGFGSALGTDALSEAILAFATGRGIDCSTVARYPDHGPGLYAIALDAAGERSFTYWRDRSAARVMFGPDDAPDFAMLDGADVVYLSAITLAILSPSVRAALLLQLAARRASGLRVAFDSNYRPRLWESPDAARQAVGRAWALTDLGFPSVDDEMALFGETAEMVAVRLAALPMAVTVLKRGAGGPLILHPAGIRPGAFAVARQVVDTTGAGDSFNGAFLAAHLGGADVATATQAAHDLAVKVIGQKGAIIPDPSDPLPV